MYVSNMCTIAGKFFQFAMYIETDLTPNWNYHPVQVQSVNSEVYWSDMVPVAACIDWYMYVLYLISKYGHTTS